MAIGRALINARYTYIDCKEFYEELRYVPIDDTDLIVNILVSTVKRVVGFTGDNVVTTLDILAMLPLDVRDYVVKPLLLFEKYLYTEQYMPKGANILSVVFDDRTKSITVSYYNESTTDRSFIEFIQTQYIDEGVNLTEDTKEFIEAYLRYCTPNRKNRR